MNRVGRYCPVEDGFDLDEAINEKAKQTKKWIDSIKAETDTDEQSKAIFKVIISELLNEL